MMMMMVMATPAQSLRQVLDIGKLAALRCFGKVRRELIQLLRRSGITVGLSRLGSALQVGGNLFGDLFVFGRVRLLKLLQSVEHPGEWRKLAAVLRFANGKRVEAVQTVHSLIGGHAARLQSRVEGRLQVAAQIVDGSGTHVLHIGNPALRFERFRGPAKATD